MAMAVQHVNRAFASSPLASLPQEMLSTIADFLPFKDLISLSLTSSLFKTLAEDSFKVRVRRLNDEERGRCLRELTLFAGPHMIHLFVDNAPLTIDDKESGLKLAAIKGRLDITNILLEKKINLVAKECLKAAEGALEHAAEHGHLDVVDRYLSLPVISSEARGRALIFATKRSQTDVMRHLLETQRISIDCRGRALIFAARNNDLEAARLILVYGSVAQSRRVRALEETQNPNIQALLTS